MRGSGKKYLNITKLINDDDTGILSKIVFLENQIFSEAATIQEELYDNGPDSDKIKQFYNWIDRTVPEYYSKNLIK